jgi:hypothetical protein
LCIVQAPAVIAPLDDDGAGEEIFQTGSASGRSAATFARNGTDVSVGGDDRFDASMSDSSFGDLGGKGLSHTIGALGGESKYTTGKAKPKALLSFWAESSAAEVGGDDSLSPEAAAAAAAALAAGTGPSNVLIPLPVASWSALSVLGGCGLFAGIKKMRRRFR